MKPEYVCRIDMNGRIWIYPVAPFAVTYPIMKVQAFTNRLPEKFQEMTWAKKEQIKYAGHV